MPLFGRADGTLVKDESPVRGMIPYLMLGRNESVVYHEEIIDLTRALPFIERWNACHENKITVFHLLLAGSAKGLWSRPGLNRFISGKRIYQRLGVQVSFAAKRKFADGEPLITIKLDVPKDETFTALVDRIYARVGDGRAGKVSTVDKELKLAMAIPGFLLSFVMSALRWLDSVNLMPSAMIDTDPMFASVFLANLGSVGIDRTWHHLYEYGNISIFGAVGVARKHVMVNEKGEVVAKDAVSVRWAFDERINDGHYSAASLRICQELMEDPERFLGDELRAAEATKKPTLHVASR